VCQESQSQTFTYPSQLVLQKCKNAKISSGLPVVLLIGKILAFALLTPFFPNSNSAFLPYFTASLSSVPSQTLHLSLGPHFAHLLEDLSPMTIPNLSLFIMFPLLLPNFMSYFASYSPSIPIIYFSSFNVTMYCIIENI
jgi:hypothetical protein